ncbi:MAG: hypothetical protein B7X04_02000 [Parcubacteria group bacterium 21-54-25]|nr:MAG: hypothetical protein B7X04_02000 [Parcubacteria group bacterium 21-54-25]HQU07654.1 hypothetical protein [Candidatus Paceibacterota bacterium]
MAHHAYVVARAGEAGARHALAFLAETYGLSSRANPDVVVRQYGLFSVEDARALSAFATLAPVAGETKALVIVLDRIYHEAQNALLKLLEEPSAGTVIILVVPQFSMLLPTVRSRVISLPSSHAALVSSVDAPISEEAQVFLHATQEKRTTLIKKLVGGKDEDARRRGRDAAIRIVDDIERAVHQAFQHEQHPQKRRVLLRVLSDIEILRGYLYDRAAPVRMILEHLSLVMPKLQQ